MPSKAAKGEPTLPLAAEERRRRVEQVRSLDRELAMIEKALLDVKARLPRLLGEVQKVRRTIDENTSPQNGRVTEEEPS